MAAPGRSAVPIVRAEGAESVSRIQVRNIWLLMLYASECRHRDRIRQGAEKNPDDLPDLIAEILSWLVERRLRRNLSFGYRRREDDLTRVRGRIDLLHTERRRLIESGRVACRFEELTVDTPRNRYVRAALSRLARLEAIDSDLGHRCRQLAFTLARMGVGAQKPEWGEVSAGRIGFHDADDRSMLDVARLAFDLAIPTEDETGGQYLFRPDRDQHWLRRLFEKAVWGFYDITLSKEGWRVKHGSCLHWTIQGQTSERMEQILPSMQTDIILEHQELRKRIIIDTKFTKILTRGWYRDETLKSGYLYQIYAYLRSQEKAMDPMSLDSIGLLLHPSTGFDLNEAAVIQGHEVRFATVDLAAESQRIREQLRLIAESCGGLR